MRFQKETELHKHLQEQEPQGVFLLFGKEEYLVSRWRDEILLPFAQDGFNYQRFDGQRLDINEIYDATQQLPLFAPKKGVLVDDVDPKKLLAEELRQLERLFADLPEETVLVLTFLGNSLQGSSALGKKVAALADSYGVVVDFDFRDTQGLVSFLKSEAKTWKSRISTQLCKELIRLCGKEMLVLQNEIQKLAAYAAGSTITQEHIDAVAIPTTEERVFDLGKAILAQNTQRALEILSNLFYLRESPVGILSTLIMTYADLYRGGVAKRQGKNQGDITQGFSYKGREFRVRMALQTNITTRAIAKSLKILFACDLEMKSTPQNQEQRLEQAVFQLISVRGK